MLQLAILLYQVFALISVVDKKYLRVHGVTMPCTLQMTSKYNDFDIWMALFSWVQIFVDYSKMTFVGFKFRSHSIFLHNSYRKSLQPITKKYDTWLGTRKPV